MQGINCCSIHCVFCPPLLAGADRSLLLSRLFFIVGQVIKEQMIHLEVAVVKELKKRRVQQQESEREDSSSSGRRRKGRKSLTNQVNSVCVRITCTLHILVCTCSQCVTIAVVHVCMYWMAFYICTIYSTVDAINIIHISY